MRWRSLVAALAAVLVAGAIAGGPVGTFLDGVSLDVLLWLRYRIFHERHEPASSPTVVIALDEETSRSDEFGRMPEAMWPPKIARVLRSVLAGGAKVVGFDVIFTTPYEPPRPEAEAEAEGETLRDYRVTLQDAAQQGKMVLGKVQHEHQQKALAPSRDQSIAVDNERNVRLLNLLDDSDDVIRRAFVYFPSETVNGGTRFDPTMAVELAARALGVAPSFGPGAPLHLGDYVVPGSEKNALLLDFDGGNDVPTYSLIDLYRCAAAGKDAYFREHFAGKVVLIGVVRDVEDRKVTSKRLLPWSEEFASRDRCIGPPATDLRFPTTELPGVYLHAAAVNNLIRGEVLRELPRWAYAAPALFLAAVTALAIMLLPPLAASAASLLGALGWTAASVLALQRGTSLPLFGPILAVLIAAALLTLYRFFIADRDKRLLRRSFQLYLAPAIVDRMLRSEAMPNLGGEQRTVTTLFSDLADFTTLSEAVTPTELVAILNAYLEAMTDIVEAHGGMVEKYVGDAIVAVFGAPQEDAEHALRAVEAALSMCRRLAALNADGTSFRGHRLAMRIGINTGEALVGNIGSRRRFNYTVMGDAVNLASRLQDLNKRYGTQILVAEPTVHAVGGRIAFRHVDRTQVKGRHEPVDVYTPAEVFAGLSPSVS